MKARTQSEFKRKWVGVVSVITGADTAKFTSIDTDSTGKVKEFGDGSDSIKIKIKDLPREAQRVIKPNIKNAIRVRIRLTDDGDGVEAVTPVAGMFPAKLVELGPRKKDQPAVPFVKSFKKAGEDENSHLEFFAVYEITEGVFKGVQLPAYFLHYKFEGVPEDEEDAGFTRFDTVDTPQASQLHRLQSWAEVQGNILDNPIVWNADDLDGVDNAVVECFATKHDGEFANILPELEERALDADRDVNVIIEKGYIKSVQAVENYGSADETEDEFDDRFAEPTPVAVEDVQPEPEPAKAVASKSRKTAKKVTVEEDDL